MRERKRNPDGKFIPMNDEETDERQRDIVINSTFLKNALWYSIIIIVWVVLSLPFTYHLFVKRNILKLFVEFLEEEFGCKCPKLTCLPPTPCPAPTSE